MSYPNYRFSVDTEVMSGSLRILSAPVKNCISGSGGDCLPVPCRVCVRDSVDITFGGVLAGIGVITLPVISSGGDNPFYTAETPFMGIETSCGTLDILFQIGTDGTSYLIEVRLNGTVIFRRAGNPAICGTFIPGMPESFTYPLDNDSDGAGNFGPNFTLSGNENGCNGEASIVVTNTSSGGDISGSAGDYVIGIDTHVKSESKRVLAGVNCGQISGGASPAMYRAARDTGITLGGKRVLVAEKDPCCDGGPSLRIPFGCCPTSTPRRFFVSFDGQLGAVGTVAITYIGERSLYTYDGFTGSLFHSWYASGDFGCGIVGVLWQCTGVNEEYPLGQWILTVFPATGLKEIERVATVTSCDPFYAETENALLSNIGTCGTGRTYFVITEVSP